jgi:hypothetical protein
MPPRGGLGGAVRASPVESIEHVRVSTARTVAMRAWREPTDAQNATVISDGRCPPHFELRKGLSTAAACLFNRLLLFPAGRVKYAT